MNFPEDCILASEGCCLLEFLHVVLLPKLSLLGLDWAVFYVPANTA